MRESGILQVLFMWIYLPIFRGLWFLSRNRTNFVIHIDFLGVIYRQYKHRRNLKGKNCLFNNNFICLTSKSSQISSELQCKYYHIVNILIQNYYFLAGMGKFKCLMYAWHAVSFGTLLALCIWLVCINLTKRTCFVIFSLQ